MKKQTRNARTPRAVTTLSTDSLKQVNGGTPSTVSVNRVKTSDKQQKAVLDFVKG